MFLTKLKLGTAAALCVFLIGDSFTSRCIAQAAKPFRILATSEKVHPEAPRLDPRVPAITAFEATFGAENPGATETSKTPKEADIGQLDSTEKLEQFERQIKS